MGTENSIVAKMQRILKNYDTDDLAGHMYGKSINNQVLSSWILIFVTVI